jgi:micrococcal nuclease
MYEYRVKICRIVDGDTVDVDIDLGFGVWLHNERVRLVGIDAPESRTSDLEEKKFGLLSKEYLKDKLASGATLKTYKDKEGKFGRILGEFIVYDNVSDSWMSVNEMMIRDHMAVKYVGQSKHLIEDEHLHNRKILIERGVINISET